MTCLRMGISIALNQKFLSGYPHEFDSEFVVSFAVDQFNIQRTWSVLGWELRSNYAVEDSDNCLFAGSCIRYDLVAHKEGSQYWCWCTHVISKHSGRIYICRIKIANGFGGPLSGESENLHNPINSYAPLWSSLVAQTQQRVPPINYIVLCRAIIVKRKWVVKLAKVPDSRLLQEKATDRHSVRSGSFVSSPVAHPPLC